jgi:hypothetical protein
MPGPRSELVAERTKLATWSGQLQSVPQFGARYCIWLIDKAREALAEQDARIASLTLELDKMRGTNLLLVPNGWAAELQERTLTEPEGTIMRDMKTGQEWVFLNGSWQDQHG